MRGRIAASDTIFLPPIFPPFFHVAHVSSGAYLHGKSVVELDWRWLVPRVEIKPSTLCDTTHLGRLGPMYIRHLAGLYYFGCPRNLLPLIKLPLAMKAQRLGTPTYPTLYMCLIPSIIHPKILGSLRCLDRYLASARIMFPPVQIKDGVEELFDGEKNDPDNQDHGQEQLNVNTGNRYSSLLPSPPAMPSGLLRGGRLGVGPCCC